MKIQAIYKQLVILLSIAWFAISCEKFNLNKEVTVKGTAKALQDDSPLVGYTIVLKELKHPLGGGVEVSTLQSTTTDANGSFSFTYEPRSKNNIDYEVEFLYGDAMFSENLIDDYNLLQSRIKLNKEDEVDLEILMASYGEVKFFPVNENIFDENDKLEVYSENPYKYNWKYIYYEQNRVYISTYRKMLSGENILRIEATKNNIKTISYDTINIVFNTQQSHEIHF